MRKRIEIDHYSDEVKEFHKILEGNYSNEQLEQWGYAFKSCKQSKRGSNRYNCIWKLTKKGRQELKERK